MNHPIQLDSLLAYAMYKHTDSLEEAHENLPLKRTNNVYHASAIRFENPIRIVQVDFSQGLKQSDIDKRQFKPNAKKGERYLYIDTKRGEHKAFIDAYSAHESRTGIIHFFANGDKEKIEALLKNYIFSIGKKHNQGYGAVESITVSEIEEDLSFYHPECGVMRNLPVSHFTSPKTFGSSSELTKFKPPYANWDNNTPLELCFTPGSVTIDFVRDEPADNFF
jgi:hypothetical protein